MTIRCADCPAEFKTRIVALFHALIQLHWVVIERRKPRGVRCVVLAAAIVAAVLSGCALRVGPTPETYFLSGVDGGPKPVMCLPCVETRGGDAVGLMFWGWRPALLFWTEQ